ncbi:DUF890 domain-containing protein [Histoplasma capsulatum var. duboisii H88]|uniref:DUF890 domain-containing protein n=1 Tax=Ajellomyces capsulatus (strain H88) TaxID=544711 RepID=A0A8A1LVR5_AJEC8|nr:DUF890 domain-containing protein [Histoplasma capsulatum var. duboisii H88]
MDAARTIYKHDVDFAVLALQYPNFAKHLKQNNQLDFTDPDAVQELTKSLLKRDFGLHLDLPSDRLCPPVPNRCVFPGLESHLATWRRLPQKKTITC